MKIIRKIFLLATILISKISVSLAQNSEPEMADLMRSNGKIYVVFAVLLVIFAGLVFFLISQEMKLNRINKKINQNNNLNK